MCEIPGVFMNARSGSERKISHSHGLPHAQCIKTKGNFNFYPDISYPDKIGVGDIHNIIGVAPTDAYLPEIVWRCSS
jgi:hypothetical protein